MLSFRQHLIRAAKEGYNLKTVVTRKPVVYAPLRSNDRFPFVDADGTRYPPQHVGAYDENGKRFNR